MQRDEWKRRQADGIARARKGDAERAKNGKPRKYAGRTKGTRNKTHKERQLPPIEIVFIVSVVRRLQEDYLDEVYGNLPELPSRRMWQYKWEFERTGKITIPERPPCPALKNMKHRAAAYFGVSPRTLYRWLREYSDVSAADAAHVKDEWFEWLDHDGADFRRFRMPSRLD